MTGYRGSANMNETGGAVYPIAWPPYFTNIRPYTSTLNCTMDLSAMGISTDTDYIKTLLVKDSTSVKSYSSYDYPYHSEACWMSEWQNTPTTFTDSMVNVGLSGCTEMLRIKKSGGTTNMYDLTLGSYSGTHMPMKYMYRYVWYKYGHTYFDDKDGTLYRNGAGTYVDCSCPFYNVIDDKTGYVEDTTWYGTTTQKATAIRRQNITLDLLKGFDLTKPYIKGNSGIKIYKLPTKYCGMGGSSDTIGWTVDTTGTRNNNGNYCWYLGVYGDPYTQQECSYINMSTLTQELPMYSRTGYCIDVIDGAIMAVEILVFYYMEEEE